MSRVYRALEKAERERRERSQERPLAKVFQEKPVVPKEEAAQRFPETRRERVYIPPREESLVAIAPIDSVAEEQFRKLKTQIFHWSSNPPHVLLVTSALPDEGKTMVAVNLALSISHELQKKAILIDADLRKPSVPLPEFESAKGLSTYLSDEIPLSEILVSMKDGNLWGIPAGTPSRRSSELIGSKKMRDLVLSLREFGDETYVVIDSPPVLSTADPVSLSKLVDGIIFVVMADGTPRESVRRAMNSVEKQKILGVVFNQKETKSSSRYYSGYSYAHHRKLK